MEVFIVERCIGMESDIYVVANSHFAARRVLYRIGAEAVTENEMEWKKGDAYYVISAHPMTYDK